MPASSKINEIGVILLAAGSSKRLGRPKQLVNYNGQSLLDHAIEVATGSIAGCVIVVLGSNATAIEKQIDTEKISLVHNPDFEEGMASSIICGLLAIEKHSPTIEAIILMPCDQPHLTVSLINDIIKTYRDTRKSIVTCSYVNTFGPPTLFHKSLFNELLQLKGDVGGRKVLQDHINDVATIPFEGGEVDIDTEADFERLFINPGK